MSIAEAIDTALDTRVGLVPAGDVNAAYQKILAPIAIRVVPWWEDKGSKDYQLCCQLFVAPFSAVTEADIAADPLAFDAALREWKRCDQCRAAQVADGREQGGPTDCALMQAVQLFKRSVAGRDEYVWDQSLASRNWYTDIHQFADGRWEWTKRRCDDKLRRQRLLADRVKRWRDYGGIKAREVDDDDSIPF